MTIGEKTEVALSSNLSDSMQALLKAGKSGDEVLVVCKVQSSDGITRQLTGTFILE